MTNANAPVALVTGGSAGLGRELTLTLADLGWTVITDGRRADRLAALTHPNVRTIAGDVADPTHRAALTEAVTAAGSLDLLVHNASTLGPTPLPGLIDADSAAFARVLETNVVAPLALTRALLPTLVTSGGILLAISSDAAVEHYPGWGLYGGSKAALDHLIGTVAAEHPGLNAYAVDPGDMRTEMHQAAFPGEDISDRPLPATVVPALLELIDRRPASGRYRASELATAGAGAR